VSLRTQAKPLGQGSLLDRLLEDPEEDPSRGLSMAVLRDGLRRDLEGALNTRRRFLSWPPELEELDSSLLSYGLSDFTNGALKSDDFRDMFIGEIRDLIRQLEPRIYNFEVIILENKDEFDRIIRFRISGMVAIGDEKQHISFDSHVDPVRCIVVRD